MIKNLKIILLFISIFFITSCSDTIKIKKFKNEVPKWYLKNKNWWQPLLNKKGVGERIGTKV